MDTLKGILELVKSGLLQKMIKDSSPMIQAMTPEVGELLRNALKDLGQPISKEFADVLTSESTDEIVRNLAKVGFHFKSLKAELALSKEGIEMTQSMANAKASAAMIQLYELQAAGFSRSEAMEMLGHLTIAQAIRDAKPSPSIPTSSPKK